ncbi:8215_t:CDS:2 [Ambispora gerdemannii]|uniref:8215_t:CDS:1 n=1 Tax=Ambispora gerdemannii TaxID=144530 RepID=A0A9N9C4Z3_9GLOM|nr:8215_t:CDS:2 [Ambispora gerdemannii]
MKLFHAETRKRLAVRKSIDGKVKASEKKDKHSSMLKKKLIKELESPSSSSSTIASQTKTITNSGNFTDLYNAIIKAEERIESTNQELIEIIGLREKEVAKQLPNDLSNAIEKE